MNSSIYIQCAITVGLSCVGCAEELDPVVSGAAQAAPVLDFDEGFCGSFCEAALQCDEGSLMAEFDRGRQLRGESGSAFRDCVELCSSGAVAPLGYAAACLVGGEPPNQCLFVADVMETAELCESLDANWTITN